MNTSQHTVTLPIADYQELIDKGTDAKTQIDKYKENLVKDLEAFVYHPRGREVNLQDFMRTLINSIR